MVVYTKSEIIHFWFNGKKFVLGGALRLELDAPLLPIDYKESTQEDLQYLWNNYPKAKSFLKLVEDQKETTAETETNDLEVIEKATALEDGKEQNKPKANRRAK